MRLESPRSQDEYDNLKKLLNNYHNMGYIGYMGFEKSRTFAIDGHKSDDYQWVDNNEEILKFQMDPNFISSYSEADCIGKLIKNRSTLFDNLFCRNRKVLERRYKLQDLKLGNGASSMFFTCLLRL